MIQQFLERYKIIRTFTSIRYLFIIAIFFSTNLQGAEKIFPKTQDSSITTKESFAKPLNDSNFVSQQNDSLKVSSESISKDSLELPPVILPKWYEMITNVPDDWWRFTKDQFNEPNYPLYILLAGATTALIINDDYTFKISDKFYKQSQFTRNFSDWFKEIGDGRTQFGLAAGFAAFGFISDDHRALKTASQIVEAVLAAGSVVQLIKHVTGRESPFVASSSTGKWRFFPNQIEYHKHVPVYDAFPSGHIATSVATFVVIIENYPEYKSWTIHASYALSALICFGMVNSGIHWYSDYPLGIAIGYAFGKLIANPQSINLTEDENSKKKLSILPYVNRTSLGLSFNLSF
ncbi:MAG: phosphatase PAP2 family protein [Ignavibacteriales bacterium]|nr:phosphatase PAP2 family protein [Ignavibacteriales bacterium]